jgi:hypothetical protein
LRIPVDDGLEAAIEAGWETVTGKWGIEDVPGASQGKGAGSTSDKQCLQLDRRSRWPYTDVDVSVRFNPISGSEDASAGIVFRFSEGRYYVIRANALEDNFNLYYLRPEPPSDHRRARVASNSHCSLPK